MKQTLNKIDRMSDSLTAYLDEIGKIPLLSLEQERELAKRVADGDLAARQLFIESNLRLVVSIAKDYQYTKIPLLDLIDEGNIGLIMAVDKYDVSLGLKFSTYATYKITEKIMQVIYDFGRNIRVPVHKFKEIKKFSDTIDFLKHEIGREPTIEEIASEIGISVLEARKLYMLMDGPISIDELIDKEESDSQELVSVFDKDVEDLVISRTLSKPIEKLFEECHFNSTKIDILALLYGLNNREPQSLSKVGKKYGVTRQRIRQIRIGAIDDIRYSEYIETLAIYMQSPDRAIENIQKYRVMHPKKRVLTNKNK